MEKIQPEINRAIEEAMKAIDINEKAAKEASKEKSSSPVLSTSMGWNLLKRGWTI